MTSETRELVGVLVSLLPWLAFVAAIALFALVPAWKELGERAATRRRRHAVRRDVHAPTRTAL